MAITRHHIVKQKKIKSTNDVKWGIIDKISMFIDYVRNQARAYISNNIMITMGGDFTYQHAGMWYKNLDKLIEYTNLKAAKDGINVKLYYSTPNCYLKAVKEANPTLPTKTDDFFPYASDGNSFWTGYFTSRPTTKYFERRGNAYLQSAKQLQVLADLKTLTNSIVMDELKSAMGIMQHHDAITGTEKQHVTADYVRILDQAVEDALRIPRQAFNKLIQGDSKKPPIFAMDRCRLNESSCHTSENCDTFVVTLYNPIAWNVTEAVRLPITEGVYDVYAPNGNTIDCQILKIPKPILDIPSRHSIATHEIVFIAHLKPLQFKSYYIKKHLNKNVKAKRDINTDGIEKIQKRDQDTTLYDIKEFFNTNHKEQLDSDIKHIEDIISVDYGTISPLISPLLKNNVKNKIKYDRFDVFRKNTEEYTNISPSYDTQTKIDIDNKNKEDTDTILTLIHAPGDTNEGINKKLNKDRIDLKMFGGERYADFVDEELRMLGDDPMVVDRLYDYFVMENEIIKVLIDNTSGAIKSITYPHEGVNMSVNFLYYPGFIGNNEIPANRSSGAYIFRPNATKPTALNTRAFKLIPGNVVKEFQVVWYDNAYCALRLYKNFNYAEIDWLVGPIDVKDGIGKEYVIRYGTNMFNNGEFYTDSNGRQVMKRTLNQRPQYNVSLEEPVGGNYYPVTNEIFIQDAMNRFTVMTDRSEGGTSLNEGEIELMLHRRLLHDDAFGVGEALNEQENGKGLIVRGTHRIMLTPAKDGRLKEMENIKNLHLQPLVFVSDANGVALKDWVKMDNSYSWLKTELPEGIHLLTLEPWGDNILIRLENYLTKTDGTIEDVDLATLLNNIHIKSIKETNLSGHEFKDKWNWNTETQFDNDDYEVTRDDGFKVKIKPKQIRTFILGYDFVQ